jgi:hypothetical protein
VLGGTTATVVGASLVWLTLALAGLFRGMGADLPHELEVICAAVAAPVALAFAIHTVAGTWRGPVIETFAPIDSDPCSPDEAAYVRLVAQLRGTMGGAGYLYPWRLLLPTASWIAVAVQGAALIASDLGASAYAALMLVAIGAATSALVFPARPYYYREATGGTIILSPPSVARRLKRRAAAENAAAAGARQPAVPADSVTPSPTPTGLTADRLRSP